MNSIGVFLAYSIEQLSLEILWLVTRILAAGCHIRSSVSLRDSLCKICNMQLLQLHVYLFNTLLQSWVSLMRQTYKHVASGQNLDSQGAVILFSWKTLD